MPPLRSFLCVALTIVCIACASGPIPERKPQALRASIRHLNKGTVYYKKGCFSKAAQHFENAHERFAASDNLQGTADSLNGLANTYYRLNDMESAIPVYDEADALYALLKDKNGRVRALTNKSVALAAAGKVEEAEATLDQADKLADFAGILHGLRLKARAIVKLKGNEPAKSKQLLEKAMNTIPHSDPSQYASAQYTMGYLLLSTQKPKRAIAYLKRALQADRTAGDHFGMAQDLESLGDSHDKLNQHADAVGHYKRSIKIYALLNNIPKAQQVSAKLAESASHAGLNSETTLHWAAQWLSGVKEDIR